MKSYLKKGEVEERGGGKGEKEEEKIWKTELCLTLDSYWLTQLTQKVNTVHSTQVERQDLSKEKNMESGFCLSVYCVI